MAKLQTFSVMAKITLDVIQDIKAEDLDNAYEIAKEMKEKEFVEVLGELNESSYRITGVFEG